MKNNKLNSEDIKYLIQNYQRHPITIVKGSGSWVYDSNGKKYLDFTTGIAVNNLGHNNPVINSSIRKQLTKIVHTSNLFIVKEQIQFVRKIGSNGIACLGLATEVHKLSFNERIKFCLATFKIFIKIIF